MSDPSKQKDSKEAQFKGVFGSTDAVADSEESKGKNDLPFEPNLEKAHKREHKEYDPSHPEETAEITEESEKKAKSLFYAGGTGSGQAGPGGYRSSHHRLLDPSKIKTALGGDAGPKLDVDVKQQDKIMKEEKLFDQDTKKLYGKDILFPLEYPPKLFGQMPEETVEADPIDFLRNDFAMLQFPQNLPLEGFYKLDPVYENFDKDLTSDTNIFTSLINQRFDSTGYYLDRDFSKMNLGVPGTVVNEKEGVFLGKLIRYKSGKIKMKIGDNTFDINPGLKGEFYQEILAVDKDRREASSLTKIQEKFVVKPDLDDFDKPKKSKK